MANSCLQLTGFLLSCLGWLCIVIATATNDWVVTCKFTLSTCKKLDELGTKGPWASCVISSTGLYHCITFTQLLELPAYLQATRALMITGSILGLPTVGILLMSLPCIKLSNDSQSAKNKISAIGGILTLIVGVCGLVSTVWFPIGAQQEGLMAFGFSLYSGWIGTLFSLLGGCILTCCISKSLHSRSYQDNNRFYYSKQGTTTIPATASTNHAKSTHI